MSPKDDEPVAYLGGKSAEPAQEVEGYLGGDAPPDSLPALPPANMTGQYSASDFIAAPAEITEEAPPPEEAPVAQPAEDPAYFQQYANDTATEGDQGTATVADPPPADATSEFDEPGLPKTISQQDAENIIKRITTKKILPPEVAQSEGPRVTSAPEMTRRKGMRLGPIVVFTAVLLGAAGGVIAYKQELADAGYLPEWLYPYLNITVNTAPIVDPNPTKSADQVKEEALRAIVLESEWRAFGYTSLEEYKKAQEAAVQQSPPPGGSDKKPDKPDKPGDKKPGDGKNDGKPGEKH